MSKELNLEVGVYSKCQSLSVVNKKNGKHFTKEKYDVVSKDEILTNDYVETVNSNLKATGVFYKKDEKATEGYINALKKKFEVEEEKEDN